MIVDVHPIIWLLIKIAHLVTLLPTGNNVHILLLIYNAVLDVIYVLIHPLPGLLGNHIPTLHFCIDLAIEYALLVVLIPVLTSLSYRHTLILDLDLPIYSVGP